MLRSSGKVLSLVSTPESRTYAWKQRRPQFNRPRVHGSLAEAGQERLPPRPVLAVLESQGVIRET